MIQKSIRINNKQVFYTIYGKGQPVVLVHGFAEDSDVWKYQLDELSKNYLLIVPDLPGSGKSDKLEDMSIESLAEVVRHITEQELANADQVAAGGAIIIGHSMGGYITLAIAEKHPDMLKGFGLFHSTSFADTEEKKATRRRSIAFIQTHGSYEFIKQSAPNLFTEATRIKNGALVEEMIARYSSFDPQSLIAYYDAMIQRPDRTAVLQTCNKPILFIMGKQDKAVPFEDSIKQAHLPQTASVHILENSAHMGMWEEKEKSSQALLSFLEYVQQFNLQ